METAISELSERVSHFTRTHGPNGSDQPRSVDRAFLSQRIAQLEQKWGSEVKALKQDLHRTILAHNHNSDLMRHHRDALDDAHRMLENRAVHKADQVNVQIEKVDRMLRAHQAKQRALEALTERLNAMEAQAGDLVPSLGLTTPYTGMMAGMEGALAQQAALLSAQRDPGALTKRKNGKEGELPTEEEVRARLLQAARGNPDTSISFNVEAPVFVPRGAVSPSEADVISTQPAIIPISNEPESESGVAGVSPPVEAPLESSEEKTLADVAAKPVDLMPMSIEAKAVEEEKQN